MQAGDSLCVWSQDTGFYVFCHLIQWSSLTCRPSQPVYGRARTVTATATVPLSMYREAKALGLRVTTPVPQKLHATAEGRAMAEQLLSAMLLVQLQ